MRQGPNIISTTSRRSGHRITEEIRQSSNRSFIHSSDSWIVVQRNFPAFSHHIPPTIPIRLFYKGRHSIGRSVGRSVVEATFTVMHKTFVVTFHRQHPLTQHREKRMKLSPVSTGYCKPLVPLHMIGPAMRWNDSGTPKNPDKRKETCVPCDINQTYPPSKHNNKDC